jgi:predicted aspartyl protease
MLALPVVFIATGDVRAETAVTFRLVHRFAIVVSVRVNDNGPYDFLLDTGTNTSMINAEFAEQFSLRVVDTACLHTIAGAQVVPRGYLNRITLGDRSATNTEVLAANIPGARALDSRIVGIVGLNFLAQFNYTIDYDKLRIVFDDESDKKTMISGQRHSIENVDGIFVVKASTSSRRENLRMVLDSGGENLIIFAVSPQYLFSLGQQSDMSWTTVFTNAGSQKLFTGRLPLLRIGDTELSGVTTMITGVNRRGDKQPIDGLLPTSLFHRVYFNFSAGYVIFDPVKTR